MQSHHKQDNSYHPMLLRLLLLVLSPLFEQVQSPAETPNESPNGKQSTHEESSSNPHEGLMIDRTVPSRMIDDIAATRIQNAFRSFMVQYLCSNTILIVCMLGILYFMLHFTGSMQRGYNNLLHKASNWKQRVEIHNVSP